MHQEDDRETESSTANTSDAAKDEKDATVKCGDLANLAVFSCSHDNRDLKLNRTAAPDVAGQLYRAVVTTSNQPSLHPMISQRRKRKVKVFLSTDSFKQAMVDTVEDGLISFDSGIKQGNARYTHLRDVHDDEQIVNDDEVQEMLNDEVQGMSAKRLAVRKMILHHNIDICVLLGAKRRIYTPSLVYATWNDPNVKWHSVDSVNNAGGILVIWNEENFKVDNIECSGQWNAIFGDFYEILHGGDSSAYLNAVGSKDFHSFISHCDRSSACLNARQIAQMIFDYSSWLAMQRYHPSRVLTLVYQPFALGTLAVLAYYEAKINTRIRNLFGYSLFFLSTLGSSCEGAFYSKTLDLATSGKGGLGTFVGICALSGAFGLADAHVQGGMVVWFNLVDPFPCIKLLHSFLAGLSASGALISALRLITKAAFDNSQYGPPKGAISFLAISAFFELPWALLYAYVFPKLAVVKYYCSKVASEGSKTVSADLAAGGIETLLQPESEDDPEQLERLSNKELLLRNIDYAIDTFLIYVLTLSIFPGFVSEDTGTHSLGGWYVLVLIALFNASDLIGRYIPLLRSLKLESRKGLMIATLSRFLLLPAFYFTTKYGDQGWMIMVTSFLGLTNGYLTVRIFTSAKKNHKNVK
ncbi:PREDICTED: equilibrative nucleotide transporter 3-like, partial [Populus euphratica]|uniref:Equilibrative nucleotide transporter 3-like n=1 Tax=Populus euphratica TaxID=75702 RepID=A0AAJ6XES9_POPEU